MNWQEYQEAVAELYEQTEGFGSVHRNVTVPDKVAGQPRQIDVLIEFEAKGHAVRLMMDAKYRRDRLDVKDVEEVNALAEVVGAHKAVIVAANGLDGACSPEGRIPRPGHDGTHARRSFGTGRREQVAGLSRMRE